MLCLGNTDLAINPLISDLNKAIYYWPHIDRLASVFDTNRLRLGPTIQNKCKKKQFKISEKIKHYKESFKNSPSSKSVSLGILNMHNIKRPWMTFPINNGTNTTQITTSGDHTEISGIELDEVQNFRRGNFQLNGVVYFDYRVGIADCATVVGDKEGNAFRARLYSFYFA